jgi:hypothetical protein
VAEGLAAILTETWAQQAAAGFLLAPEEPIETRLAPDPATGVEFRFRWLPHRELRGDPAELERRGILAPVRNRAELFRDPRDPNGHHCFLCETNIRILHPIEILVPVRAGGRRWWAGANFAPLARDHFTVMSRRHCDQEYGPEVLEAMADIHHQTGGAFRVVFNAADAGATIPRHLHLQITSEPLPVEALGPGRERAYPTTIWVFPGDAAGREAANATISSWLGADAVHHRVNLLFAGDSPRLFVLPRDARRSHASNKGLMGGFEVAGDFAFSEPRMRHVFETADLDTARKALGEIKPG